MKPGQREGAAQLKVVQNYSVYQVIARHWIVEDVIYLRAQTKSGEGVLERQVTDKL